MAIYAVGDIQGCLEPLKILLDRVQFDPLNDQLWAAGDIINRGPQCLETLRFCHSLGKSFRMVLGNHDLHLLAVAHGVRSPNKKDTLDEILAAPDREELLHWLQQQPLFVQDAGYAMVHAGIPPIWSLQKTAQLAAEVESVLKDNRSATYFSNMYGNEPDTWSEELTGTDRWRVITNYLTRLRFCTAKGQLNLDVKTPADKRPANFPVDYQPWFSHPERKARNDKIIFGHWAALQGKDCGENLFPLDTGCVWGGPMRMMNLESGKYFHHK